MDATKISARIADAWESAFGLRPTVTVDHEGEPDVMFSVEEFVLAPDTDGGSEWSIYGEVAIYPSSRWEPVEVDLALLGTEPDLDGALAAVLRQARAQRAPRADTPFDPDLPF